MCRLQVNKSIICLNTVEMLERKFIAILFTALFVSCRAVTYEEIEAEYIPVTDTVTMSRTCIDCEIFMPLRVFVTDGLLVVCQEKSEHLFVFFRLPLDGKGVPAGFKGRGPDEFVHIDARSITPCPGGFKAADSDGTIKRVRTDPKSMSVTVTEKMKVPINKEIPNGLIELEDYCLNYNLGDEDYEYVRYDKNTWERHPVSLYPEWEKDDREMKVFRYMKNIAVHPSGRMFAACYAYYPKIRLMDQSGTVEKEITLDCDWHGDHGSEDRKVAYSSFPFASEHYFADIFYGEAMDGNSRAETELHVWDWSGAFLCRLVFDNAFSLFCIDDTTGMLYAVDGNIPDVIYSADLSPYLQNDRNKSML